MKKQVIAVDIDDVLSSQIEVLIAFSNQRYGTMLTRKDFDKPGEYWGYYESLWDGEHPEERKRRVNEFKQEKFPLKQLISVETKEVVNKLAKKFHLEIVTSRDSGFRDETVAWLQEHLPEVFNGVHFVELWDEPDKKATKALVCQEIGAGYLIDDNLEHCNLAAECGVHALLFGTFGWNIGKPLQPGVKRVADWQAVAEYFGV